MRACRRGRLEATGTNEGHAVDSGVTLLEAIGAIGGRGTSWSEQLDDKELRGALGSAIETERIPVLSTSSAHLHLLQYGMLILKGCVSSVIPL